MNKIRIRVLCGILLLALLALILPAPLAHAGPPDPRVVTKMQQEGGDDGDEGGDDGAGSVVQGGANSTSGGDGIEWGQYEEAPISPGGVPSPYTYQGGGEDQGSWWPPDIGKPLQWIGQQLNPGKWVVDSFQGGLITLGKGIVTSETWIILFFMGLSEEVTEAYQAKMEWQERTGQPPPDWDPFEVPDFKTYDSESWDGEGNYIGRNIVVYTPATLTWQNGVVDTLWRFCLFLMMSLLFLVMIYGGFNIMLSGTAPQRQSAGDFLLRAFSAGFLGILTMPLWGMAIKLCNLVSQAVAPPAEEILIFQQTVGMAQSIPAVLEAIVAAGIFLLVFMVVVGIMLVRLGLLCFLIIVGPLAILAWIFPRSRAWFDRWIRMSTGIIILQPLLMLTLRIGMFLMQIPLDIAGVDPKAIGTKAVSEAPAFVIMIAEPLVGVAMLVVCLRLTSMLMNPEGSGGYAAEGIFAGIGLGGGRQLREARRRERAATEAARDARSSYSAAGTAAGTAGAGAATGAAMLAAPEETPGGPAGGEVAPPSGDLGGGTVAPPSTPISSEPPRMPRSASAGGGSTVARVGTDAATMTSMGVPPQAAVAVAAAGHVEELGPSVELSSKASGKLGETARATTRAAAAGQAGEAAADAAPAAAPVRAPAKAAPTQAPAPAEAAQATPTAPEAAPPPAAPAPLPANELAGLPADVQIVLRLVLDSGKFQATEVFTASRGEASLPRVVEIGRQLEEAGIIRREAGADRTQAAKLAKGMTAAEAAALWQRAFSAEGAGTASIAPTAPAAGPLAEASAPVRARRVPRRAKPAAPPPPAAPKELGEGQEE